MKKSSTSNKGPARERILDVASDLFYRHGFRATGINEIIDQSGVAKATFYSHFPSKEDLGVAYLEGVLSFETTSLEDTLNATTGAEARYFVVIEWLRDWLRNSQYRGCAFMHTVAEIPDPNNPMRRQGKRFYTQVRHTVLTLVNDLIAANKKKYGRLNAEAVTDEYMIIYAGTIAMAQLHNDDWPVDRALEAASRLIGK